MRAILAALTLAFVTTAAAGQGCLPHEVAMAIVISAPDYASHSVATAAEAKTASDIFNAAPPESDIVWTVAVLVSFRDGSGGLLVGRGAEICGSLRVAPDRWPGVLRSVRGSGV